MVPSSSPSAVRRWPVPAWALLALAAVLCLRFLYLGRDFELDDALIYRRYVDHFLHGKGLVWNPGERWNALTSPLYAYLLIAAGWLLGDLQLAAATLAAVCTVLTLGVFFVVFARAGAGTWPAALGALLAASSPFLYQTLGMETPLFLLLAGACLLLAEGAGTFWLGLACAMLVLTRSEGVFLVLALAVRHLRLGRPWPPARDFALPAALVTTVLAINWTYYGEPLAHTAGAKIDQGRSGLWGPWPVFLRAGYHLDWFFAGSWTLAAALGCLALWGAWGLRRTPPVAAGGPFLVLLAAFYVGLDIPNYHWYCAPFYLFAFFFAGAGAGDLVRRARGRRSVLLGRLGIASAALLAAALVAGLWSATEGWLAGRGDGSPYRRIGLWLKERAAPGSSLAVVEIGTVGWYSGLPVIDILGLASPHNSRFVGEGRFDAWLQVYRPDHVLIHDPPWPVEAAVVEAARRGRFARDRRFPFADFRLYRQAGEAGEPIGTLLEGLRQRHQPRLRRRLARAILGQGLYDPIVVDGPAMQAVHLTDDRWTRGTEPAAVAVGHRPGAPAVRRLRLACVAGAADLPITVTLDAGDWRREVTFEEAGFRQLELPPVAPGRPRLVVLWTDKAWSPGPQDPRSLGVKLFAAEADGPA